MKDIPETIEEKIWEKGNETTHKTRPKISGPKNDLEVCVLPVENTCCSAIYLGIPPPKPGVDIGASVKK